MFVPELRAPLLSALAPSLGLNAISALFNPATQFAAGQLGAWYDPSDYATLSQDSAGTTPVTGVTQPVGRALDKSGRNNTLSQATAASRPITGAAGAVRYWTLDGVDDGFSTGPITLSADMDCFIAVRRNSAAQGMVMSSAAAQTSFFGVFASGDIAAASSNCGTPTYFVNGVAVPGGAATTRDQLHTAIPAGAWAVVEIRNLNLAVWTSLNLLTWYNAGFNVNGDCGGIILPQAGDATTRQNNRRNVGNKVGLTLP